MKILLIGADGGLGVSIHGRALLMIGAPKVEFISPGFDVRDIYSVKVAVQNMPKIDAVIYAAGVNLINPFVRVTRADFFDSIDVNCYGFINLVQELLYQDKINEGGSACLVTSNAANMPMTHSLSYNCSKAAANMAVKQMAREIRTKKLVIFGVAPNKLYGTFMSANIDKKVQELRGWSADEAKQYQINALPARRETSPGDCAEFILTLIFHHTPWIHGTIIPYGGPQ